ncbi:MAG: hypothetical protein QGH33_20580, partial [Pirellulaceae bacterium]|nr:hypothetical protein [Pirellulaceae bacterium]
TLAAKWRQVSLDHQEGTVGEDAIDQTETLTADDVMQEVGLACWNESADFQAENSEDAFFRWAYVARLEILK